MLHSTSKSHLTFINKIVEEKVPNKRLPQRFKLKDLKMN